MIRNGAAGDDDGVVSWATMTTSKERQNNKKRKRKTCLAGSRKSSMLLYYVGATSAVVAMHRQRSLCAGRADPIRPSTVQFTTRDAPCITRTAPPLVIVPSIAIYYKHNIIIIRTRHILILI